MISQKRHTVSEAMGRRLLRLHLTGDPGPGNWRTMLALSNAGLVELGPRKITVTDAGRAWCDAHHLEVRL